MVRQHDQLHIRLIRRQLFHGSSTTAPSASARLGNHGLWYRACTEASSFSSYYLFFRVRQQLLLVSCKAEVGHCKVPVGVVEAVVVVGKIGRSNRHAVQPPPQPAAREHVLHYSVTLRIAQRRQRIPSLFVEAACILGGWNVHVLLIVETHPAKEVRTSMMCGITHVSMSASKETLSSPLDPCLQHCQHREHLAHARSSCIVRAHDARYSSCIVRAQDARSRCIARCMLSPPNPSMA